MTAMSVRSNDERDQHIESQERRIEALEEIIRVQADTIARLTRAADFAVHASSGRVHGGARA